MADEVETPAKAEEVKPEANAVLGEINQRIVEIFGVFDHESNKTVDKREISAIVRALGCYPSESELSEILLEVEEEEPSDFICLDKFQPVMLKILVEKKFRPVSEEMLLKAFEVLDQEHKGHLTREELVKFLTEEGEPFSSEEIEELMAASLDPQKGFVNYREYVQQLVEDN